eukprot:TRINITY_DN1907_c1_g1_i2.p1 TRINITY_DN1907_c1_g1~~TRINITY_DN1907_c1_g1_i2.p1  ORF type:complete len:217 (+),score=18.69 TRINITY_DN1907_c1_g1_i2:46-696(+)
MRALLAVLLAGVFCGVAAQPATAPVMNAAEAILRFTGGSLAGFWDNWNAIDALLTGQLDGGVYTCMGLCQFTRADSTKSWSFVVCHACNTSLTARTAEVLEDVRYDMRLNVASPLSDSELEAGFDYVGYTIGTMAGAVFNGSAVGTVLTPVDPPASSSTDTTPSAIQIVAIVLGCCMVTAGTLFGATRIRNRAKQEREYENREAERDQLEDPPVYN